MTESTERAAFDKAYDAIPAITSTRETAWRIWNAAQADFDRRLALQQASYEREIAIEREAERERCAKLCDSLQYATYRTPVNCAEAIRAGKSEPALDERRLFDAIVWALGAHETDGFRESYAGDGPYWWRAELAQRAGLVWDGEKYVAALSPPSMDGAVQAATSGGER